MSQTGQLQTSICAASGPFETGLACFLSDVNGPLWCGPLRSSPASWIYCINNALLVAFPLGADSRLCLLKCITFPNVYATSLGSIVLMKIARVVPRVIVPSLI